MSPRVGLLLWTIGVLGCAARPPVQGTADTGGPVTYRCESGRTVEAVYRPPTAATVRYQGQVYEMTVAVSGSGARYIGGGFEWWTRGSGPGSEGMVLRHNPDGMPGDLLDRCPHVSG